MQEGNKRIAKNTLVIYTRILITMIVGLFSSRYVLQSLGVSDFGLYNVVGSIIGMYGFIASSLSVTTTRFLNFEMGKKNGNVNRMFNICLVLHIVMAFFIFFISETFGIWYINNHLNVESSKEFDAMFCFQISIIVTCIGIINVPYQSIFQAHEKFIFIAVVDIVISFVRFGFVVLLIFYEGNCLLFYAVYMSLLSFGSMLVYYFCSKRNWSEYERWNFVTSWKSYKNVLSFNGYTFLHTASMSARNAGSNLLVNMFFGTVTNAAFAIAKSVEGYVETFMATFDSAAGPQITQGLSAHDEERVAFLVNRICRISILLVLFLFAPLYTEMDFLLKIWLVIPPVGASNFAKLILIQVLVASTSGGLAQLINGFGQIKWFKIEISLLFLLCLPVGYILFSEGFSSETIILLFILSDVLNRIIELVLMKYIIHYDIKRFLIDAYFRPFLICLFLILYIYTYSKIPLYGSLQHFMGLCISIMLSAVIIIKFGFKPVEKKGLKKFVIQWFFNKNS